MTNTPAPNRWTVSSLKTHLEEGPTTNIGGTWVPLRPMGLDTIANRLGLAIAVFAGRADALFWTDPPQ